MSADMMSIDMSIDGCSKRRVPQKVSHLKYIPFLILIMSYVMVFIYNFSSVSNIFLAFKRCAQYVHHEKFRHSFNLTAKFPITILHVPEGIALIKLMLAAFRF